MHFCKQQQQQQHSLLSQASWGRLEMKPKRHKGHGSGMLIASLQALLSKANSSEISQSLRCLLTDSSQVGLGLPLPLFTLSTRFSTPLHFCKRTKIFTERGPWLQQCTKHSKKVNVPAAIAYWLLHPFLSSYQC